VETLESDILVIDDDEPTADFITELLRDEGYISRSAYAMEAAVAAVNACMPSLILLDLQMTGKNTSLLDFLRNDGAHSIPVILMSAGNPPPSEVMLRASDFLAKPFDIEDLLQCVELYIGKPVREPGNERAV
jgi:two-component system, NtrC family, nitrogen regulation response regulator NtrX